MSPDCGIARRQLERRVGHRERTCLVPDLGEAARWRKCRLSRAFWFPAVMMTNPSVATEGFYTGRRLSAGNCASWNSQTSRLGMLSIKRPVRSRWEQRRLHAEPWIGPSTGELQCRVKAPGTSRWRDELRREARRRTGATRQLRVPATLLNRSSPLRETAAGFCLPNPSTRTPVSSRLWATPAPLNASSLGATRNAHLCRWRPAC